MTLLDSFERVSKATPCTVCGHIDWCLTEKENPSDPARALCQRVESARRWKTAGWLHVRRGSGRRTFSPVRTRTLVTGPNPLLEREQAILLAEASRTGVSELAVQLQVSVESLTRLGIGRMSPDHAGKHKFDFNRGAWSFPMRLAGGEIVGIRLRLVSGKKLAINGSKNALFIPSGLSSPLTQLLVAEGESDTAALLDLGYDVIGRPGCKSGAEQVVKFVRQSRVQDVVIVSDPDAVGVQGAFDLAARVRAYIRTVRIIQPPPGVKDARAWRIAGARRDTVDAAIAIAPIIGATAPREVSS